MLYPRHRNLHAVHADGRVCGGGSLTLTEAVNALPCNEKGGSTFGFLANWNATNTNLASFALNGRTCS
ncbi:hypothetical protein [Dactylosporangium darangshiense]|uniref:hypothetical protein n=1 Tax=Dactylosporangium darangshiense TaxID=579108 RepID=UPI003637C774